MVYVSESQPGTSKFSRIQSDFNSVGSVISGLKSGIPESSIRDSIRLGKFKKNSQHPRPILAKFNRPTDVLKLLSLRASLPNGITFKSDLSRQERQIEAILLKERWRLIQSGLDRKTIRIRNNSLYVKDKLHCKVENETLITINETTLPSPVTATTTPAINNSDNTTQSVSSSDNDNPTA